MCSFPFTPLRILLPFFFFNDTATTEIYTLSLHDALPISETRPLRETARRAQRRRWLVRRPHRGPKAEIASRWRSRSEEHTSELQSRQYLVCRLLLEKKKNKNRINRKLKHVDNIV